MPDRFAAHGCALSAAQSLAALGFGQLHLVNSDVTAYKQSISRTSTGAEKWLDVHKWGAMDECVARMRLQGRRVLVTHFDDTAVPITVRAPSALRDPCLCAAA